MGVIAVVVLGAIGTLGYFALKPAHVIVTTAAQGCTNTNTSKLASLFSDDVNTMIRLSNPDLTDMHILRTEPANVLPGMFGSLLSLSADSARLAYVTATDENLDNAKIEYVDVANPNVASDLADVSSGLWVVKPAWSQDHQKLAFVKLNLSGGSPGQFELWVADTTTQPATAGMQADLLADNFTNGHSASLCWTPDGRVELVPNTPMQLPPPSPTPKTVARPSPSASPSTGTPCGVPIFSQQDPAWRTLVMQAQADPIGGYGCALTSAAMVLNYYGATLTPAQLNTCLGAGADPVAWSAVPQCTNGLVSGGTRIPFTWPDLDSLLLAGRPAIVGMLRGLTGSHFVVVTSGGGGLAQNYHITDPWDATTFKTLGSYVDAGYNPTWIISYIGPGHNCGRFISGGTPSLTGISDGGVTKTPVTINILPTIKNITIFQIAQLSSSAIIPDTVNTPINFKNLVSGQTISDEGVYQVLLVTQAPSQPPVIQTYKFTIDRTAPAVDLSLLNPVKAGDAQAQLTASGTAFDSANSAIPAATYPLVGKPGMVRIQSSDTLSGVLNTTYSLDGSAIRQYSDDNNFNPVLVVPQSGNHALTIHSFDAAGNEQDATKYFTVVGAVTPTPHPTPHPTPPPTARPTPPRCTAALVFKSFVTTGDIPGTLPTNVVTVTWSVSGGCKPFHGTITSTFTPNGAPGPMHHYLYPITLTGTWHDTVIPNCGNQPNFLQVTYTFVLTDSNGKTVTGGNKTNVCGP
jgi:hypothetical protein